MEKKTRSHWLALVVLALAQFMVVLDVSIVNVMLTAVQKAFNLSSTNLQWIVTAYTLAFGGFLLLGGRAADLFGRRRTFMTGVGVFAVASFLAGLSQSGGMLISLRLIQGLAAAFMSPSALSIVLVTYKEGHERNVALAVWGAVASGGAAVGMLLGGVITQYLGWRWNFYINVPISALVLYNAPRLLPKHEAEEHNSSLDIVGALLVTSGLMSLVYALVKAPSVGWSAGSTLAYFATSAALLIGFVVNEARTKHPMMPLSIFKIRNVSGANLMQLCSGASLFSVFFFASLYIQNILHYSPIRTGLSFLAMPIVIALTATNAPRVVKRVGYKRVLMVGPLVTATGLLLLARLPVHGHYFTDLLPGFILMAGGMGFTFVSVIIAATSGVAGHLSGLASGLVNTGQQVGGSLGLAILSAISSSSAIRYLQHAGSQTSETVTAATVHSFHAGFYVAVCFAVMASLLATFVIKQKAPAASPSNEPAPAVH